MWYNERRGVTRCYALGFACGLGFGCEFEFGFEFSFWLGFRIWFLKEVFLEVPLLMVVHLPERAPLQFGV